MNVLVIGKGGREHAIVWALKSSNRVHHVYCFPGREGFQAESLVDDSNTASLNKIKTAKDLVPLMKEKKIDLVVIGPEKELHEGWSDVFRSHGFLVFGPGQKASQLEGSKIFAKEFMRKASIPTSPYFVVESVSQVMNQAQHFSAPYVLKADGLAAGKGVFICSDQHILKESAEKLFKEKIFGKAGEKALLEEFQFGRELSVFIFTNGQKYCVLPLAQDYKKLKDKDQGPNTGGMGALAPIDVDSILWTQIQNNILQPTVQQMKKENLFYHGVLYVGLMLTQDGPQVLEYNVRFGDPECQVLLPLLEGDMGSLLYDVAQGRLPNLKIKNNLFSCCVVLAEKDYPDHPKKGVLIKSILPSGEDILSKVQYSSHSYFLHAGTKNSQKGWLVDGGRVLNVISLGSSKDRAIKQAYALLNQIPSHNELYYRKDIGS